MDEIHTILGVCPQFDTVRRHTRGSRCVAASLTVRTTALATTQVWPEMTVSEHLAFYARLKGVRGPAARALVQRVAEKVQLDGDPLNMVARCDSR